MSKQIANQTVLAPKSKKKQHYLITCHLIIKINKLLLLWILSENLNKRQNLNIYIHDLLKLTKLQIKCVTLKICFYRSFIKHLQSSYNINVCVCMCWLSRLIRRVAPSWIRISSRTGAIQCPRFIHSLRISSAVERNFSLNHIKLVAKKGQTASKVKPLLFHEPHFLAIV